MLFGCGDILRKCIELAFRRSTMLPENIEQRGQRRVTESSAQRVRRNRINHVKPNLILPLRRHDDSRPSGRNSFVPLGPQAQLLTNDFGMGP
jgi:hypothetical protein